MIRFLKFLSADGIYEHNEKIQTVHGIRLFLTDFVITCFFSFPSELPGLQFFLTSPFIPHVYYGGSICFVLCMFTFHNSSQ